MPKVDFWEKMNLGIEQISLLTGVAEETLREWELEYHAEGEMVYSDARPQESQSSGKEIMKSLFMELFELIDERQAAAEEARICQQ